jgi:hypothetical protein
MGLREKIFGAKREPQPLELPAILQPEGPVNYNSVLDYLVGLSDKDYRKMTGSADVYRKANKEVAKIVGVKDEPTHTLLPEKPTDEEVDAGLDTVMNAHPDDLVAAFESDDKPEKPKKVQSAKSKTIKVKDDAAQQD